MKIEARVFHGIAPRIEPRLLSVRTEEGGGNQAVVAENTDLLSGILKTFNEPASVVNIGANKLSIFPYNDRWLSWETDVDVVKAPIAGDQYQRIYYTGDGVPKVRGIKDSVEYEYDLGLPKPVNAPTVASATKTSSVFQRVWNYYYEESDGTVSQRGSLTGIVEVTPNTTYQISSIPARTTASGSAKFTAWFEASSTAGSLLGYLFPSPSQYAVTSDFYLDGAKVTGVQVTSGSTATVTLTYQTSRSTDYEVDRAYVYTFVTDEGEEGPPSDASTITQIGPNQDGVLSGLDTSFTGNYNITKKRIYRSLTTDAGPSYFYVDEIDLADSSFTDTLLGSELGDEIPSQGWDTPPSTLTGLVALPGGYFAGFVDRTVYFSHPYQPHAWPLSYALTVNENIVALGVNTSGLVVLTEGFPYIMIGNNPASTTIERLDSRQSCISKRSVATAGDSPSLAVVYSSPDGLTMIEGAVVKVISDPFFKREQWLALNPDEFTAEVHDNRYYAFSSTGGILYDFGAGASTVVTLTTIATGLYSDLATDTLYMIVGEEVVSWNAGTNPMTLRWRSKEYIAPRRFSFSCARVRSAGYPMTLRFYGNGTLYEELTVTDDVAFRVPVMRDETIWQFEVESDYDVKEVLLSTTMRDL